MLSYEKEITEWINVHIESMGSFDAPLLRVTSRHTLHWAIEVVRDAVGSMVAEKMISKRIRIVLQPLQVPLNSTMLVQHIISQHANMD
jgi:hypothetical protein